jgi:predicted signal transduction protein with EAL and GGDEF domain
MASLAGTTLVWRGTALDNMWALNPRAYKELAPFGRAVGIPFLLLSFALAVASIGWFKYRLWGWRLAVAIIATQVLGDLVNAFMGDVVRGSIGFAIAVALLVYLLRSEIRSAFASGNSRSVR